MNKLKALFTKLLFWKVADLDNDGKIETLQEEVKGLLFQFSFMSDQLNEVNDQLDKVVAEEEEVLRVAQKRIEKVKQEKEANQKVQEKLKDFIV
ncbi:hypothetical protein Q7A53_05955 [Halobacillus rhizosphaerae]|uniref:hypothetical protein n=1 Tax=Halobacillus rhizosphaerae TaxID=3064889 RepID=UPI00398B5F94